MMDRAISRAKRARDGRVHIEIMNALESMGRRIVVGEAVSKNASTIRARNEAQAAVLYGRILKSDPDG